MTLTKYVNTFGRSMIARYGERVHKIALDADFRCPNRDGTKGRGGCTFCNNVSFSPNGHRPKPIADQIAAGKRVIAKRTGARKFIAYFQAYTNTYGDLDYLRQVYDQALAQPDVIGLSIGTRPDCLPPKVADLLAGYRDRGYVVWLELGLQSAFDQTLQRVNRGHGVAEYHQAMRLAWSRGLPVCTHLIAGLPGESEEHVRTSLQCALDWGSAGLKLHPLHVVTGTRLAKSWRRGEYQPLSLSRYIALVATLIELTPTDVIFHRLTGTASSRILLAPAWCAHKWIVLNGIERELARRGSCQGAKMINNTQYTQVRNDEVVI